MSPPLLSDERNLHIFPGKHCHPFPQRRTRRRSSKYQEKYEGKTTWSARPTSDVFETPLKTGSYSVNKISENITWAMIHFLDTTKNNNTKGYCHYNYKNKINENCHTSTAETSQRNEPWLANHNWSVQRIRPKLWTLNLLIRTISCARM